MSEPFVGEIKMFAGNFAPRNYALCNGQILPISQNQALFSILGTTYGGNGQSTFALPDMRGRAPIHWGQGTGLSNYILGQFGGVENVTLNVTQMPQHVHTLQVSVQCNPDDATVGIPTGNVLAIPNSATGGAVNAYTPPAGGNSNLGGVNATMGISGNSLPHSNQQPYLAVTFIIALFGIFPSRN
jgi:microcystin-dependent protein